MQTDFYNAFLRHWNDAEYLYNISRWANSDQLYAYSAECGLKCLMLLFGMYVNPATGIPDEKDKLHIDKIWYRYETYRAGIGISGYFISPVNPFDNWNIGQRYANEINFDKFWVDHHLDGAKEIKKLLNKAVLEGRLNV